MLNVTSVCPAYKKLIPSTAGLIISCLIVLTAGCGVEGGDGPALASLSTSTEEEPAMEEITELDEPPVDVVLPDPNFTEADAGFDGVEDPTISVTSTPSGATALLTWDPSDDLNVEGYYVYYGKQPSGLPGSCSYEESQTVETPPATISGLEPNTTYFFAISAYGESESPCSNEVLLITPPAQT